MRYTSRRRRPQGHGAAYRGGVSKVAETVKKTDVSLPADDPEAVQCESCGAYVKKLSRGQPRAHAPGGLATNTRAGRYSCSGSGTLA